MVKKIAILVFLIATVFVSIIMMTLQAPQITGITEPVVGVLGGLLGNIVAFVLVYLYMATTLLFWVGIPAGWNFARDRDWNLWMALICSLFGLWLSLQIAIVQLVRSRN